ncbi:MAG: hypothetical protein WCV92_03210 [Candidatus Buchananbacteria bacterium]
MKKLLTYSLVIATMVWSLGIAAVVPASAATPVDGTVIKSASGVDIYYVEGGQKHRFLNPTVLKSWYFKSDAASSAGVDFSKVNVQIVNATDFNALPTGSDVTVRPGTFMIQFGLATTIYAVGPNAELYKVDSPATAAKLFGSNWGKKVVVFPSNYNNINRYGPVAGTLTSTSLLPNGSLVKFTGDDKTYVVTGGQKKVVTAEGFIANSLNTNFVKTATDASSYVTAAGSITGVDSILSTRAITAQGTGPTTTGNVTVSLAANTPAGVVIPGQAIADLAHFTFTGTGTITKLIIKRTGISADTTLNNVYLYDGNTRLTDAGSVSNGFVNFANPSGLFTVSGSRTISVRADILAGAAVVGQVVGASINSSSDIAGTTVGGTFPVSGNFLSVANATLATADFGTETGVNGAVIATTINANTNGVTVWSDSLTIGTRAVTLKYLKFKQIGSVVSGNLQNFKLFVDGLQVGTAGLDGDNNLIFDLSSGVTLNTGSRTVELRADVVSGASKTFSFSVQQPSDAVLVDSNYGVALVPIHNAGAFAALSTSVCTINGVQSGSAVTVTTDPSYTATQVVKNSSNVTLGKWIVKAYGEDVKVMQLNAGTVVTHSSTTLDTTTENFNNVAIYVDGVQVGSSQTQAIAYSTNTAASTYATSTFGSGNLFTVTAGTSRVVEVRADLSLNSATNVASVKGQLEFPANQVQGVASFQTWPAADTLYDAANSLTVVSGSLTGGKNSGFVDQTVSPTVGVQKIGSYVIQASNADGVNVSNLAVAINTTGNITVNGLADLYVDYGTQSGKVAAQASNNFPVSFTIPAGGSKTVDVYATISTGVTGAVSTTLAVTGRAAGSSATTANLAATAGQTITIGTGTLIWGPSASNLSLQQSYVNGGQTYDSFLVMTFKAATAPVTIDELGFGILGSLVTAGEQPAYSVTVNGITQNVVSNSATLTGLNLTIPTASTTVRIGVRLNGVGNGIVPGLTSGGSVTTTMNYIKYHSGSTVITSSTPNNVPTSYTIYVLNSLPTVSLIDNTSDLQNGTVSTKVGSVKVVADAKGDITVNSFPLVLSATGMTNFNASTSATGLIVKDGGSTITTSNTDFTSGTSTVTFTGGYLIQAGTSKTFDIYTQTLTNVSGTNSASVSMQMGDPFYFNWLDTNGTSLVGAASQGGSTLLPNNYDASTVVGLSTN